jgi:predicted deacylase
MSQERSLTTSKKTPAPGAQKTASKARRPDISIGDAVAPPGKVTRLELPIARLVSGSWLTLPVAVVHGTRPGPVIWASAAIHGDELNGVPVIRRVIQRLNPKVMSGTLIAAPIVNVFGLLEESRYLPDRRDLNRSFPGTKRGSLASQLAHLFMTEIVNRCELGIDIHTGSGGRTNLPQIRCDDDPETVAHARRFGPPVIFHASPRTGTLRTAARRLGIRVLLYEAGEALRFDAASIALGVDGTLRVMHGLDMIADESCPPASGPVEVVANSTWIRATRSGFCQVLVSPGDRVAPDDEIAVIFESLGRQSRRIAAGRSGVVIGVLNSPLVHRGNAIVHIAELESP